MNRNRYPLYGLALLVGAGVAVWAGLPPALLLILLVCPLMMFAMHGMHGGGGDQGHEAQHEHESEVERGDREARKGR